VTLSKRYTPLILRGVATSCAVIVCIVIGHLLQQINIVFNPILWASLQVISAFLSFSIAANVLVRFLGTGDRASLILGSGFVLSGFIQLSSIVAYYYQSVDPEVGIHASLSSLSWMISQTLLATLLLAAFPMDERLPWPRRPKRVVLAVMTVVGAAGYLTGVTFLALPRELAIRPGSLLPRLGDLVPAGIFLAAAVLLYRSKRRNRSAFDAMLFWVAGINAICHFVASESSQQLDAPAVVAQSLNACSYILLVGASMLDNVRLFGEVQDRARSDSLTGLANHRRLVEILQSELERSGRTNRPFSIVLMDLDGLKEINDKHGHLIGSRAICRVAGVLRQHCRSVDTAARYGGDEFALILPETDGEAARQVAARIQQHLASEVETPQLGLSAGTATYPQNGTSVQHLLEAADRQLYSVKAVSRGSKSWRQLPLGL
jgi:diguanylate cyclase (GGDEF)-like protein